MRLLDLTFLRQGTNLVVIGNPGVGKTFLARVFGWKACQANPWANSQRQQSWPKQGTIWSRFPKGRVLAVELKQSEPELECEGEAVPSVIRLRTEDGTILRSRFQLVHRYWEKSGSA